MTSIPSTGVGGGNLSAAGAMTGVNSKALIPSGESAGEGSAASLGKSVGETLEGDGSDGEKRPNADGFHEVSGMEKMETEDLADSNLEVFEDAPETLAPVDGDDQAETLARFDGGDEYIDAEEKIPLQNLEITDFKADSSIVGENGDNSMVLDRGNLNLNVKREDLHDPATYMDAEPYPMVADSEKEALVTDRDKEPKTNRQAECHLTAEEENSGFSPTDMVWGKIKSHPWWPGQIFDQKYASDLALKHRKKDQNILVAYFGDKTFAWCEESQLKPFRPCFTQMERQADVESFVCAVEDSLEEVSRRVELGMLCHCMAEETYSHLKNKEVENTGIQEGTCRAVIDKGSMVDSFVPQRLSEYVKSLACCPLGEVDRLELVTATTQIRVFYRSKGVTELAMFSDGGKLVESDVEVTPPQSKKSGKGKADKSVQGASDALSGKKKSRGRPRKIQEAMEDGKAIGDASARIYKPLKIQDAMENGKAIAGKRPIVRPRKLQDAAEDEEDVGNGSTLLSGKKRGRGRPRKVQNKSEDGDIGHAANGEGGVSGAKSTPGACSKRQRDDDLDYEKERRGTKQRIDYYSDRALKIGDAIRSVASQAQEGSPSIFKSSVEESRSNVAKGISSTEYPSPEEMLSQLCLVARDPIRGYGFVPTIVSFFTYFNSLNSSKEEKPLKAAGSKRGRKKKVDSEPASPVVDKYLSDRRLLLDSSPETDPVSRGRKRKKASEVKKQNKKPKFAEDERGPPVNTSRPSRSGNQELAEEGRREAADKIVAAGEVPRNGSLEKVDEYSPTALILSFTEADALPSAADLIKIFSPYGPLKEDETGVMKKTNRAKVVFKRRNDAETAFSSAGKYSVFGPALFSYRLRYLQSPAKAAQATSSEDNKDAQSLLTASQATCPEDKLDASEVKLDASKATFPEEKFDTSQAISPEDKKDVTSESLPIASQVTTPEDKKDDTLQSLPMASHATSEDKKDDMPTEVSNMELQAQEGTVVANDNT